MKTKSIRAKIEDAERIEQTARELGVELKRQVTSSEVIHSIIKYLEKGKEEIKKAG